MNLISMAGEWTKQFDTLSERLFLGTAMALVGFLIVFILLIAIIIAISIMSGTLSILGKPKTAKPVYLNKTEQTPVQETNIGSTEDEKSLIAVITAAIAAFTSSSDGSQPRHPGFIVKKIKRL